MNADHETSALPHFTQKLATQTLLPGLPPSHNPFGCCHNIDSQSAKHAGNLVSSYIHAAARTGYALQIGYGCVVVRAILQIKAHDLFAFLFRRLEVGNISFFFQNARDLQLQLGSRDVELLVPRVNRIANARQEICDRIGQTHFLSPKFSSPVIPTLQAWKPAVTYCASNSPAVAGHLAI